MSAPRHTSRSAAEKRKRKSELERAKLFAASGRDVPLAAQPCPTPHKTAFANKPAARTAARRIAGEGVLRRDEQTGRLPRPYRCVCGRYHLGHLPGFVVRGEQPRATLHTSDQA